MSTSTAGQTAIVAYSHFHFPPEIRESVLLTDKTSRSGCIWPNGDEFRKRRSSQTSTAQSRGFHFIMANYRSVSTPIKDPTRQTFCLVEFGRMLCCQDEQYMVQTDRQTDRLDTFFFARIKWHPSSFSQPSSSLLHASCSAAGTVAGWVGSCFQAQARNNKEQAIITVCTPELMLREFIMWWYRIKVKSKNNKIL